MATTPNAVSILASSQFPAFITENNPNFVAFVRAYYEWMETSDQGAVLYHAKNLLNYRDIDATPNADFTNAFTGSVDSFINYFKNDFLPFFPNDVALDEKKLIKLARQFYSEKGTEESTKFLFRVLYNKDLEIYYPKQNILRASDGKWQKPQSIKVILSPSNENFDVELLQRRQGIGDTSNASCIIETATKTIDKGLNREIVEIFISNINKLFAVGEHLVVNGTYPSNNAPFTFSEKIIGSISNLTINPKNQGLKYRGLEKDGVGNITYPGDPVVFYGGLANTAEASKAIAFVNNVSTGQIKTISALQEGFGYRAYPNSNVKVISASGNGANVIIQSIANTVNVSIIYDSIAFKVNANIGDPNYGFTNAASANINTSLSSAFTFQNVVVGGIHSMNVINGGSGYRSVPTYNIASEFDTDLSAAVYGLAAYPGDVQYLRDLGLVANVTIINGGTGYSNVKDKIIFTSAVGYGANIGFTTDGAGKINSVSIISPGTGYPYPLSALNLTVANSANVQNAASGSGAALVAYGLNEGELLETAVSDIGRIFDFRIVSRGFDYISTPSVSLRVIDMITTHVYTGLEGWAEDIIVYQGANANSATFTAYLDKFGSDFANSILRVYNYSGAIDLSSNMVVGTTNTTITGSTVYGNGKAKANVQFLNGIINYDGFYLNTDGQPSADQFIQNYTKYHNYSYILQIEKALNDYKDAFLALAHPAGTEMIGEFVIKNQESVGMALDSSVSYIKGLTGNVTVNAYSATGIATGHGTSFVTTANSGDLLVLSTGSRQQTKTIKTVSNNTSLVLESNTAFFGGVLNTNTAISTVSTPGNVAGIVLAGDGVAYNVNNTIYSSSVTSVAPDGLSMVLNTSQSQANVLMLLHFNETNGSNTISDAANNYNISVVGSSPTITSAIGKFGNSASFTSNLNANYFSANAIPNLDLANTSFCVECFAYPLTSPSGGVRTTATIFAFYQHPALTVDGFRVYTLGDNSLFVQFGSIGSVFYGTGSLNSNANAVVVGQWNHVAIVSNAGSGQFTMYVNGTSVANTAKIVANPNPTDNTNVITVGGDLTGAFQQTNWNGYIDEFRFTFGTPVYTGNFTPPTAPFTLPTSFVANNVGFMVYPALTNVSYQVVNF